MIAGHSFLKKTFGIVPTHAWQLDSMGGSAATPDLYGRLGFETLTIGKID